MTSASNREKILRKKINIREEESIDQINQLTEVKSMLAQLAKKIENRGLERGVHKKYLLKMPGK